MKHRLREALFNLLRDEISGRFVLDLFAGTGAVGLEAISRGAGQALFLEQHRGMGQVIQQNVELLGISALSEVVIADTFTWCRQDPALPNHPWLVFCCPPYELYASQAEELKSMLEWIVAKAPTSSTIVVEAELPYDLRQLGIGTDWEERAYPPAVIGIHRINRDSEEVS